MTAGAAFGYIGLGSVGGALAFVDQTFPDDE